MPYRQTERSERVREATMRRILGAARRLFARRGYEATTVQEIVDAAKSSIGNFYFYFENKEAVLLALLQGTIADAWRRGDEVMASTPLGPSRAAVMIYANAVGYLIVDKDLMRLLFADDSNLPVQQRLADLHLPRIRAMLRENFPDYPESSLDIAATAWGGAGRNSVRRAALGELDIDILEVPAFLTRWNLRGIGVPEAEIDAAIAYAHERFAPIAAAAAQTK